jgi:hypothetical protein
VPTTNAEGISSVRWSERDGAKIVPSKSVLTPEIARRSAQPCRLQAQPRLAFDAVVLFQVNRGASGVLVRSVELFPVSTSWTERRD